jgi:heme-degrading monooxygenase HmoA
MRKTFHVRGVTILRDATDPNSVTLLTRFDSVDDAKATIASDKFREASKGATLSGETFFNQVVEEKSY